VWKSSDVVRQSTPNGIYFVCAGPAGQPSLEHSPPLELVPRFPDCGGVAVRPLTRSVRTIRFAMVTVSPPPAKAARESMDDPPPPLISDEAWIQIEKASGYKLDAAIRSEVLRVTASFVMFEPFERDALPSAKAEKRVKSIKGSEKKFFNNLFNGPSDDANTLADELIDRHFNRRMPQLRELLLSLAAACNSALAEMESSPSHREGAAWDRWIRRLTTILEAVGLPTTASNGRGKSKSDSPSSFVSLVLKLQDCVPKEARRHNTPDGLAMAINRVRRRQVKI
jgi:hypothetical protein